MIVLLQFQIHIIYCLTGLTKFSLSELETATNGFSDENLIGRGGSVSVYKVLHLLGLLFLDPFCAFHMTVVINGMILNKAHVM